MPVGIQLCHTNGTCRTDPFAKIKRKRNQQRKVVWTHGEVNKFLDVAYSDFEYRNIGLIVHGIRVVQRLGDMRNLTWDCLDLKNQQLSLEQSKRRAQVFLPISDNLNAMLLEQKAIWFSTVGSTTSKAKVR